MHAASAILLFSSNCSSDVLKPYLNKILSRLVEFLERGMTMMQESAQATLASLAVLSQEDSAYLQVTAFKDSSQVLLTKSLECMEIIDYVEKALLQEMGKMVNTIVKLIHDKHPRVRWATIHATGKLPKYLSLHFQERYHRQLLPALLQVLDDFENLRLQVTSALVSQQETNMEDEDLRRSLLLQAQGSLCKSLVANFLPYLSVATPNVLKFAVLQNYLTLPSKRGNTDDESLPSHRTEAESSTSAIHHRPLFWIYGEDDFEVTALCPGDSADTIYLQPDSDIPLDELHRLEQQTANFRFIKILHRRPGRRRASPRTPWTTTLTSLLFNLCAGASMVMVAYGVMTFSDSVGVAIKGWVDNGRVFDVKGCKFDIHMIR